MGSDCSTLANHGSYPIKETLESLYRIQNIGNAEESPQGCGNAGFIEESLKRKGWEWPNNGEFQYGGQGSACKMCTKTSDYGCDCTGADNILGYRGKIKRVAFKGDHTKCCINRNKFQDGFTCDPRDLKYENGTCDDVMPKYCEVGDRSLNDPACITYMNTGGNANSGETLARMKAACSQGDNFTTPACQSYFKKYAQYEGDEIYNAYCAAHPDETVFCACRNYKQLFDSPQLATLFEGINSARPECNIKECAASSLAYHTADMERRQCAPQTLNVCGMNINVNDKAQVTDDTTFQCIQGVKGNVTTGSGTSTTLLYVIIAILVICAIAVGLYVAKDTDTVKSLINLFV